MYEDKLLLGKNVADKIKAEIVKEMPFWEQNNTVPALITIRLGEKPDDIAYESSATSVLQKLGIDITNLVFSELMEQCDLEDVLEELNEDRKVHGILIFRPLPKHINEEKICNLIKREKDVDCVSKTMLGEVFENNERAKKPCTAQAVIEILKHYNIKMQGKNIVVLGRSNVIGKPVSMLLLNENATVTICHSKTKNLEKICQNADILVSAIGKAHFVNANFVKDGAIVVDVGINELDGKIVGDVDFDNVIEKVSFITPVPRGVGSVTTSILAQNLLKCVMEQARVLVL